MHCSEFLELYSDYRDGVLTDSATARSVHQHLRECEACMAYDTMVCRGVFALRATSDLEPSRSISIPSGPPDESTEPTYSLQTSLVGGLMIAAAVTLLFWPTAEISEEVVVDPPEIAGMELTPPSPAFAAPAPPAPTASFSDSSVPAYRQQVPAPQQREVSFETWVALPQ